MMFPCRTARLWTLLFGFLIATAAACGGASAQDSYSGSQYDVYREAPDPEAGGGDSRYGTPTQAPSRSAPDSGYGSSGGGYGNSGGGAGGGYGNDSYQSNDAYRSNDSYQSGGAQPNDAYQPPRQGGYGSGSAYNNGPSSYDEDGSGGRYDDGGGSTYSRYDSGPGRYADDEPVNDPPPPYRDRAPDEGTYSEGEILDAGHSFFGSVSKGLANVIEYAFQQAGRPNGYILGEDAGGAFVAGLRYGEGRLHTRFGGSQKVYWQGPSIGYDFGGEGSKTMVLVYNMRDPSDIYQRFPGVQGSAYVIGGVGIQFQKKDHVTLAPIRSGVGLRLGANIGYLKYTRSPTWNPF